MSKTKKAQPKPKVLPISAIPEVQALVDLGQEIDALRVEYPDVFIRLRDLVDQYNAALETAEAAVRERGVSCGPFTRLSTSVKIDPEGMYEELGEDQFLACGGKMANIVDYTVDKEKVGVAIATGKIPAACVPEFTTSTTNYKKPSKLSI